MIERSIDGGMSPMRDDLRQRSGSSRLSRRTLLRHVLGAAGAAFAIGSQLPTVPSALAAHSPVNPGARAQPGSRHPHPARRRLRRDSREDRCSRAGRVDAFDALKRAADGLVMSRPADPDRGGGDFTPAAKGTRSPASTTASPRAPVPLASVYRLTDDPAYAQAASEIVLGYAARYQSYEAHDMLGRTGGAGLAPRQGALAGPGRGDLAGGAGVRLRPGPRDPHRRRPRDDRERLLRPAADLLMGYNVGRHNHQSYFNLGIGLAGLALDDPRYVEHAIRKAGQRPALSAQPRRQLHLGRLLVRGQRPLPLLRPGRDPRARRGGPAQRLRAVRSSRATRRLRLPARLRRRRGAPPGLQRRPAGLPLRSVAGSHVRDRLPTLRRSSLRRGTGEGRQGEQHPRPPLRRPGAAAHRAVRPGPRRQHAPRRSHTARPAVRGRRATASSLPSTGCRTSAPTPSRRNWRSN